MTFAQVTSNTGLHGTQPSASTGSKVLIVDDNQEVARALEIRLHLNGYQTRKVCDGRAAIEAVEEFKPRLMLLDLRMPQMDGFAVLQALGKLKPSKELPEVVVLSANLTENNKQRAKELGARYFVGKPYDAMQLMDLIATVIHR